MCDVHVPGTRTVPVEEIYRLVKLFLCLGKGCLQVATEASEVKPPVPFAAGIQGKREFAVLERLSLVDHEALCI